MNRITMGTISITVRAQASGVDRDVSMDLPIRVSVSLA
jgi:hypothetical protein